MIVTGHHKKIYEFIMIVSNYKIRQFHKSGGHEGGTFLKGWTRGRRTRTRGWNQPKLFFNHYYLNFQLIATLLTKLTDDPARD